MKKINILIGLFIILYLITGPFYLFNNFGTIYTYYINPIFWLLLFIFTFLINYSKKIRILSKKDKMQNILIIILFYLIIYYASGFIFGYVRSPYSQKFIPLLRNMIAFVSYIFFQEYIRQSLLPTKKMKWYIYIFFILVFSISDLNLYNIEEHFNSIKNSFEYISTYVVPTLAKNWLFTYLAFVGGYKCNLLYRIPIAITTYTIPLFPKLSWFMEATFNIVLSFVVFININFIQEKLSRDNNRHRLRKHSPLRQIPFICFIIFFVCFVAGFFTYMPVAVMSNSMYPLIKRGDVVIVEKLNEEELDNLQVNDIVQYKVDSHYVVHRIVDIVNDNGEKAFVTKGDNNNLPDNKIVYTGQIMGIIEVKFPFIGYPAVLFNEIIRNMQPQIEV